MNTQTFLSRVICAGLFAGFLAGTPLSAAGDEFRFGAGAHIVNPDGDIKDAAKMGFGLSVFGEMGLDKNMALRGRVDYNMFGKKTESFFSGGFGYSSEESMTAKTVFVDYIYSANSCDQGLYVFGGLGLVSATLKAKATFTFPDPYSDGGSVSGSDSDSRSGSNFGYTVGLGYNFTSNLGAEASIVRSNIKFEDGDEAFGCNWLQVSFKYRF